MTKVLLASVEAKPYATAGGTSDVVGSLFRELQKRKHDVRLVLPYYSNLIREPQYVVSYAFDLGVPLGGRVFAAPVYADRAGTYLIGGDPYGHFARVGQSNVPLYPALEDSSTDAGKLYAFYCRAVLELVRAFAGAEWLPDIIHCHDWPLGLLPAMIRSRENTTGLRDVRSVFTIHNMSDVVYQGGWFDPELVAYAGLPEAWVANEHVLHDGHVNFIKAGVVFADRVNTVSEGYAHEILDGRVQSYRTWDGIQRRFQCSGGLEDVWSEYNVPLIGIRNGIDDSYTPARIGEGEDWQFIDQDWVTNFARSQGQPVARWAYTAFDPEAQRKKGELKRYVQGRCNRLLNTALEESEQIALVAVRSRLTEQKGFDLILKGLENWVPEHPVQIVIIAWGEERYARELRRLAGAHPNQIAFSDTWRTIPELLHYAAADMLLMPSLFEPCGLPHMMALRYGTVPIVRRTGGLADVIQGFDVSTLTGNGFVFQHPSSSDMLAAVERALALYNEQPSLWSVLRRNAMEARDRAGKDFSWATAVQRYITELYRIHGRD